MLLKEKEMDLEILIHLNIKTEYNVPGHIYPLYREILRKKSKHTFIIWFLFSCGSYYTEGIE